MTKGALILQAAWLNPWSQEPCDSVPNSQKKKKKNRLYLSPWIISALILLPPWHSALPLLLLSGSDVTPNYSDSSPSNITISLWCTCRGTGGQEPECDAFHRDFTHNTCLSECPRPALPTPSCNRHTEEGIAATLAPCVSRFSEKCLFGLKLTASFKRNL